MYSINIQPYTWLIFENKNNYFQLQSSSSNADVYIYFFHSADVYIYFFHSTDVCIFFPFCFNSEKLLSPKSSCNGCI